MIEYTVRVSEDRTEWLFDGKRHREDGPAIEYSDGSSVWCLNGKRHREDGPAREMEGYKDWWKNDKLHREDGPAREWSNGSKEWYLNGKELTEEEFLKLTQPVKELTISELQNLLGYKIKVVE